MRKKRKSFIKRHLGAKVTYQGNRFFVDIKGSATIKSGVKGSLLNPSDFVVDVGATLSRFEQRLDKSKYILSARKRVKNTSTEGDDKTKELLRKLIEKIKGKPSSENSVDEIIEIMTDELNVLENKVEQKL